MIDLDKINFNKETKIHMDSLIGAVGEGVFVFSVVTGETLHTFAAVPYVMKSAVKWMNEQIKEYEEQFGEIKNPKSISPYSNLNKK